MIIPQRIKEKLKKPLGNLQGDFNGIKKLSHTHRIISVGDVCTLNLLANGIKPHLAVFDYRFMRQKLDGRMIRLLHNEFKKPKKYKNAPGTLSEKILTDATELIANGGAVLIEGEEDLTALAFIRSSDQKDIVIYGQPHRGIVVVKPNNKLKIKIEKWLASALTFGHEVKRDKRK